MRKNINLFAAFLLLWSTALLYSQAKTSVLKSGPMLGYVDLREASVWIQTSRAAAVSLRYWPEQNVGDKRQTSTIQTEQKDAYTATLIATDLEPGVTYQYEVLIDKKAYISPYRNTFATQPLWQWRSDPPTFRFAAGSCMYIGEQAYDRPGKPYGGEYRILDSIAGKQPDFMLWLGDNTYLREVDWNTRSGVLARHTHTRNTPELQKLLAITHHYAIWDDHDYGPNNSDRSYAGKRWTEEAFRLFWPALHTNITGKGGITGYFQWGDCEFFLMDDRYHRTPNNSKDPEKVMLGKDQVDWLLDALSVSFAPFKFVAVGNQVLFPKQGDENLTGFPAEYERLINGITERKIPGVVFLTGDRHHTELTKLERPGFYPLYDFTISPLTAGTHQARDEGNTLQVPGTLVNDRNYAIFEVSGPRKNRILKVSVFDLNNTLKWTRELSEAELR